MPDPSTREKTPSSLFLSDDDDVVLIYDRLDEMKVRSQNLASFSLALVATRFRWKPMNDKNTQQSRSNQFAVRQMPRAVYSMPICTRQ